MANLHFHVSFIFLTQRIYIYFLNSDHFFDMLQNLSSQKWLILDQPTTIAIQLQLDLARGPKTAWGPMQPHRSQWPKARFELTKLAPIATSNSILEYVLA